VSKRKWWQPFKYPGAYLKKRLVKRMNCDVLICADDPLAAQQVIDLANVAGCKHIIPGDWITPSP
jgi:predicted dinucleotide-binding enzyme